MKFKKEYLSQKELGKLFGVSSHVVGRWLIACDLRNDKGYPTNECQGNGMAKNGNPGFQGIHWHWNAQRTTKIFREAGHKLAAELPADLVYEPELKAPFQLDKANPKFIANCDGFVVVRTNSQEHAIKLKHLMDLASQKSFFRPKTATN